MNKESSLQNVLPRLLEYSSIETFFCFMQLINQLSYKSYIITDILTAISPKMLLVVIFLIMLDFFFSPQ